MGSFDLVPVYYCGNYVTDAGRYYQAEAEFDYVSNSIVIDV